MQVKAEICWNGGHSHSVRLTLPSGLRLVLPVPEEVWCRAVATRAKDLVQAETGIARHKIRFI